MVSTGFEPVSLLSPIIVMINNMLKNDRRHILLTAFNHFANLSETVSLLLVFKNVLRSLICD